MMIVINNLCGKSLKKLSASPEELRYFKEYPCYKLDMNELPRRRLEGCFTEHEEVRGNIVLILVIPWTLSYGIFFYIASVTNTIGSQ